MPDSKAPKQCSPRRRWPVSEKRRIVELTLRDGASMRAIAREYGVNRTSLSHWRSLYRAGKLDAQTRARARTSHATFLPVTIAPEPAGHAPRIARESGAGRPSVVQATLPSGATLRIETGVLDTGVVCALIAQLQR